MPELVLASGIITRMAGGRQDAAGNGESDEALAERVRATGDVAAFGILVTRYRARVVALARRMLAAGGSDEAEDIAQEAFVAVYDKRASFRRGEPFRPWLYRIAVNRCLDRLRAQSRRPPMLDLRAVAEPSLSGGDPLEALLTGEGEQLLSAAVAALSPKLRAVFLLRHLDDLSYEEISAAAGVPLGTVKTHLFRARALLRVALSEYLAP